MKIRVFDGRVRAGQKMKFFSHVTRYESTEVGLFQIKMNPVTELAAGEVGYLIAGIKNLSDTRVGDTVTQADKPCDAALPGFRDIKPTVFAGLYPVDSDQYEALSDAMQKLKLNDDSLTFRPDNSPALGFGFRCGFLGLLHLDIIRERLKREFDIEIISTAPNVVYRVTPLNGEAVEIHNPGEFPTQVKLQSTEEPFIKTIIIVPSEFVGNVMKVIDDYRGTFLETVYLHPTVVKLSAEMPFAEIVYDFNDRLKSVSKGYASFDYEFIGFRESDLARIDVLVSGKPVDALSLIAHRDQAQSKGRVLVEKLRKAIPRHLFDVPIQASVGGKIIARETIKALRKDVLAKCYGGDISRKRKLLDKQKEGKKRMKKVGSVDIPQEAFLTILERD
jgi:GTP-binding protein LepA